MTDFGHNKLFEVVGWAELAKPNMADLLGFTFVQPNLRDLPSPGICYETQSVGLSGFFGESVQPSIAATGG